MATTEKVASKLEENLQEIKERLGHSSDLVIRKLVIGAKRKIEVGIIYIDGLVDKNIVQDSIIKTLMLEIRKIDFDPLNHLKNRIFDILQESVLTVGEIQEISDFNLIFQEIFSGNTVILLDGFTIGFTIGSPGWEKRGINEPTTEPVIRGPKDSFIESLRINTALIRRKIKDPNLWLENMSIGEKTKTDVAIAYINGLAKVEIIEELKSRLAKITIDGILDSGYIEELIQEERYTLFPTVRNTERPDIVAASLLEGRIVILVDGSPFALILPALFFDFFKATEDYYINVSFSILVRTIRYTAFILSLLVPAIYIAVTTFHQEMIPTALLISIAAQREGIPFPALIEALIMELTFEILREAGIRMPRAIGSAISIVGALVLGQAAVEAGIVSPVMVIVVALTAISNFASPTVTMSLAVRILRFFFMLISAVYGLYGIGLAIIALILHLCSLRSLNVPYMSPLAPNNFSQQKDIVARSPYWKMQKRNRIVR